MSFSLSFFAVVHLVSLLYSMIYFNVHAVPIIFNFSCNILAIFYNICNILRPPALMAVTRPGVAKWIGGGNAVCRTVDHVAILLGAMQAPHSFLKDDNRSPAPWNR